MESIMAQPLNVDRPSERPILDSASVSAAYNQVSWGAIFAGVFLALASQFLLNLLGVGIGAAVLDPATTDNPAASTFSIVGGIWYVVAGIIAAFIGGYVASRLSGRPSKSTGGFHGVTVWAVTTIVVLYLLTTSVGALVGGAFSGLSSVVGGAGQAATSAASSAIPVVANATNPMGQIEQQIRDASGGTDPEALRSTAISSIQAAFTGDPAKAEEAKTRAADALARAQNIPADQARKQIDEYQAQYTASVEKIKQEAINTAQTTTTVISSGAILAFFALLLGAVGGWFGGTAGTKYGRSPL
jgi:hypothetical protein